MTSRKTESKINAKGKTFGVVASVVKAGQQTIAYAGNALNPAMGAYAFVN